MNRLQIGPGLFGKPGWKSLDADAGDFIATIPPLPESVKAQEWDEIEWIHGITSLYPWDAAAVLKEIRAVLAPGGKLVLEQPDFDKAKHRPEWIFGDPTLGNPLHMNRWAYVPETLIDLLEAAGFIQMDLMAAQHHRPERDFRIEAFA